MGDLSRLPFPVAYPLHWTRDSDGAIQVEGRRRNAIFTAFQAMRLSALLMLSDYLAYEGETAQEDRELARHIRGLRFPHWQEWTRLANGLAKFWSDPKHRDHAAFPRIVSGWRAVAVASGPEFLPLIAGWAGPGGSPAARTANDAIWELRNRSAHREGVATPDLQREIAAETARLLPLVEAIVERLFGDGSLEIVRSFTDPADGTPKVIRLVGPRVDLVFPTEPCDPRWVEALGPTAVAALVGDRAIAVYPFLVPTDDPESRLATGIDEPVAMIDGVSEARLTVMGVRQGATLKNEHLQATLAALRARHGDLELGRRNVQPWTVAAWSRMTAQQTLDDLRDVKYFPAFYLERPGVDDLVASHEDRSGQALLFIGEAGSGKSSLIARLVDRLLRRSAPGTDDVPSPDLIVYLTGAADYAGDAGMAGERLMVSVVARKLGARADDFASLADLLHHLDAARANDEERGRRIWLLFDALNEADRFGDLVGAVDAVLPLLERMPNLRLVLSIRSGAYHARAARDRQLGVHRTEVFDNAALLFRVPDAKGEPRPYLDVRPFSEEHEGRQAYELRRTALPGRAADVPYERLSQQLRNLLLTPLYLHLFHEAFSARAADGAVVDVDEAALLDAYLDEIARHQAGIGKVFDLLGEAMLTVGRAFLPIETADAWIDEWYRANRFVSVQAVVTLDPIEQLVSASVLVRPTEEGLGADRRLTGYRFVQQRLAERVLLRALDQRLAERVLLRALDQPIAPRLLPSAEDLRRYAAEAAGPPVFEELVGALADWVGRLVLAADTTTLAALFEIGDRNVQARLLGALVLATARVGAAEGELLATTIVDAALSRDDPRGSVLLPMSSALDSLDEMAPIQYRRPWWMALTRIPETLAAKDPGNAGYQNDLSVPYERLGNLAVATGNSDEARDWFTRGLKIAETLAAKDPANAGYQRDLSVPYERLGNLAVAAGNGAEARDWFTKGLKIRETLAAKDPGNAGYQRDLSVSYSKLGDLAVAAGNGDEARNWFTRQLKIAETLAAKDPANAGYQRDLSVPYERLGNLAVAAGNGAEARDWFTRGLKIAEALVATYPGSAGYQRNLSVSYSKLGDLAVAAGMGDEARDWFTKDLEIAEALAAKDPGNAEYQRGLSISFNKLGDLAVAAGNGDEARDWFTRGLEIAEGLAAKDPGNAGYQRDLSVSYIKLGELAVAAGNGDEARSWFTRGLEIAETLAATDPGNAHYQRDLSVSCNKLGELAAAAGNGDEARNWFTRGLEIAETLAATDPGNTRYAEDLGISHFKLAQTAETTAVCRSHLEAILRIIAPFLAEGRASSQMPKLRDLAERALRNLDGERN